MTGTVAFAIRCASGIFEGAGEGSVVLAGVPCTRSCIGAPLTQHIRSLLLPVKTQVRLGCAPLEHTHC